MAHREPLSRVDAAWLHMDRPENTADIVSMMELDGLVPLPRLLQLLRTRLLARHPRFLQRIVEGPSGPAWERDPRFELRRHVLRRTLPAGDRAALARLLSEIATEDLPAGRPRWRVVAIDMGRRTLAVVKLHHCIGDGFALISVLLDLSDEHAHRERAPAPVPPHRLRDAPARLREAVAVLLHAPEVAVLARSPLASARALWRMVALGAATGPLGERPLSGVRRVAWSGGWPLREVREAARAAGATVNDLLLAALAGALRRRLLALHPVSDPGDVRALVPVNLRPRLPGAGSDELGNRFGLVFAELPVAASEPAARLAAVHARLAAIRRSPDAPVTLGVLGALGLAPAPIEQLGTAFFSGKASLVITNVPGPRRRLHLGGRRIDRLQFWVPHPSTLGIGVSLLSYGGELTVGVRADAAVLRDPAALVEGFEAELAALAPAAAARRHRDAKTPATRARPGPGTVGRPVIRAALGGAATSPAS